MKKFSISISLLILILLVIGGCTACGPRPPEGGGTQTAPGPDLSVAIVIGDEDDRALAEQLQSVMGDKVPILTGNETSSAATEILIGKTDRELSAVCGLGVREKDWWIRFFEGSVVIQGGTPEKLAEAVNYFAENHIPAWQGGEPFPTESDSDYLNYGMYSLQSLTFDGNGIYEYRIVTKDGAETEDALRLQQHIEGMSSYRLPIISPSDLKEGQKGIIFGSSGARDAKAKCAELERKEYLIEAEGDSLYLCAWEEAEEYILSYMFLGETIGCQLYLDTPSKSKLDYEDYRFKFTLAFDGSDKFKSMSTQVGRLAQMKEFNIMQGGCTDGTYAYYVMQDQQLSSGNCLIVKMDPKTWEILQVSEPLPLDHGNGITYLPETNELLVANCSPDPTLVTWVDADTLTMVRSEHLPYSVYSLSWNPERKLFAGYGLSKVMLMINEEMEVVESYNGLASSYTTQGYDVDDDYVYIVSCTSNYIHVCDWEGHWIETIPISVPSEMENMISFGDLHYTTFLNAGADIYVTIFYRVLNR